jgi:glucosyl-dolichyl phosphate glucuronosyltransferase
MNVKLTIAICTFNRLELLKTCLNSILNQEGRENVEILVIDNNSTDKTLEFVNSFKIENNNIRLKYILEKEQGLSHARNRAIKESSTTDYIAYIDDDAQLLKGWILEALRICNEIKPDAAGGPVYSFITTSKPKWFKEEYGWKSIYDKTGWLEPNQKITGCNMLFNKKSLIEFNGFDTELGMKGYTLAYGEESKVISEMMIAKKKVFYSREMAIKHLIPEYKMYLSYFLDSAIQTGKTRVKLEYRENYYSETDLLNQFIEVIEVFNKLSLKLTESYQRARCDKNFNEELQFIIENIAPLFYNLSYKNEFAKSSILKRDNIISKIRTFNIDRIVFYCKKWVKKNKSAFLSVFKDR